MMSATVLNNSLSVDFIVSANKVAIQALTQNVKKLKIPDISGKASKIDYSVSG